MLFFDEVQASIAAISSLRYFYEKYPELHLIAAGSLLEFALEELPSFGVGRVRSMFVYPFSFEEFMIATDNKLLWDAIKKANAEKPLMEPIHNKALSLLKKSVSCYRQNELYFWKREEKNSSAEVDYLIQQGEDIIPIEVKSGNKGSMRSLHLFTEEKKSKYAIRCSAENFGSINNITIISLYSAGNIISSPNQTGL